ncbi:macrolide export ATP-binding/permease protein MacB [Tepidanaerobacter syntrophicus]|uniref:ABC transport system ATP-binding protein n=3 Tax=Tepidanaerobacter syntrophicus TaxID=224999 RepID=A0A0U9HCZ3_9FIRM|nr:ABC transporter ATP-binding protein [Tepidanaerobacter syntrophicus]GAQ24606.1 ABC transport system ATP-binding protein [Tepidanaerobacter syntrophicus]GLI19817.1 macrolide export ATP-binding/permease protein MacB [Tepidanaerobacter syntrophicus]GLI51840.1 macrolide export ATP-binding/permease protein MacB [Tepidanaerobacter syntrophicus]
MLIQLEDIYKIYKLGDTEVHALDGITLGIEQGEFIAIVGPSGSGKSTLMNILGCLDTPTEGSYLFEGKDMSKLSDDQLAIIRNKHIGFVFQSFNLLPKLDAVENVEVPLTYAGKKGPARRERAVKMLEIVGLGDRIHHKPKELSGGQQQRVAIARALSTDPPVILADEPTGNLDTKSGTEIMQILKELNKSGKTVILITHDINIAKQAQRNVHIQDGKIIEDVKVAG